jgi:hypothetical protein
MRAPRAAGRTVIVRRPEHALASPGACTGLATVSGERAITA